MADKPYLSDFKKFADEAPTNAHRRAQEVELYSASDRAAAVLLASLLERSLETLLRTVMRPNGINDIFDYNGPCGGFSTKTQMAYALSLIGKKTRHDLNLVRVLRNGFAHSRRPMKFTAPAVQRMCARLLFPDFPNVFLNFDMLNKTDLRP